MEEDRLAGAVAELLAPFIPVLARSGGDATGQAPHGRALSGLLRVLQGAPRLREALDRQASPPADPRALEALGAYLTTLFRRDHALAHALEEAARRPGWRFGAAGEGWRDVLGRDDKVLARLEMVRLLRSGLEPEEIAARFGTGAQDVLRLNGQFSLAGVPALLGDDPVGNWLDRLDPGDPILRRLDMVRLLNSGTPVRVVARHYDALPEYVERIREGFSRRGIAGILTEEDMERFRSALPPTIRVCSYNLHGTHGDGDEGRRLRRIAGQMARLDPQIAALQEAVSGEGIEDTSAQIARWISSMTGYHYHSQFAYCHLFMEKYPEGIAVSLRSPAKRMRTVDLTDLPGGLRPCLPRNALLAETEIVGRKVVVGSVHLDHAAGPDVRLAQARRLVREVEGDGEAAFCSVLAGDFNDEEESPVIRFMKSAGFVDAYRACHRDGGNTYPAGAAKTRIDYIFVRGGAQIVASGLLANDPDLSDHIGIYAEIR